MYLEHTYMLSIKCIKKKFSIVLQLQLRDAKRQIH